MEKQFTIKSLDNTDPSKAALDFAKKEIIFTYNGRWFYRFGAPLQLPSSSEINFTYYGTYIKSAYEWVISGDVKSLINHVDSFK